MECFYLPNYSSESNPKERLNSDLKQSIKENILTHLILKKNIKQ